MNDMNSQWIKTAGDDEKAVRLPLREVLARIGDKWSLYVVCYLSGGPLRFNELKRNIQGISQRMLTRTLRALEQDGLVARTVHASMPLRVDYELSSVGMTLAVPVEELLSWAEKNRFYIESSRRRHVRHGDPDPA